MEGSQQGGDTGSGVGPAAAYRKGLEGVETKIFAKLCGAESSEGGSQEPPVSGLWKVVAAHSIPAQAQRILNGGGLPAAAAHFRARGGYSACHNKELVLCHQQREHSALTIKAVLLARRITAKEQPGRDGT